MFSSLHDFGASVCDRTADSYLQDHVEVANAAGKWQVLTAGLF
jgi:hypothetical protein